MLKFPAGCGQFATIQNGDSVSIFFSYVETLRLWPRRNAGPFSMAAATSHEKAPSKRGQLAMLIGRSRSRVK
jgi:hypothetical protein